MNPLLHPSTSTTAPFPGPAPSRGRRDAPRTGRDVAIVCVLTVASLAPFLTRPLHIDDPFYVWVARHVESHPLDFFGLEVNWTGREQPLWEVNKNPPLASCYMAAAAAVVGWSEISLHLAFLPAALAVLLGTYALAGRWCRRPLLAALCLLTLPVFFLSATTLMSDTLMLAFYVWAAFFWVRGLEEERARDLAVAGLLASLSFLTKYFGVTLLPLFVLHAVARRRPLRSWLPFFLIPVAATAGYEVYTGVRYGIGLFSEAAGYAMTMRSSLRVEPGAQAALGCVFVGGCVSTLLFFVPFVHGRRSLLAGIAAVAAVCAAIFVIGKLGAARLDDGAGIRWGWVTHSWVFAAAGIVLLALPLADLGRHRDSTALTLAAWLLGTLLFAVVINWTTNGRAVLPLAPAAAILLARAVDARLQQAARLRPRYTALPVAAGLLLALGVAWGDASFAAAQTAAVDAIKKRHGERLETTWFQGHWGFQYYMQEAGARPIDYTRTILETGDLMVLPLDNTDLRAFPDDCAVLLDRITIPGFSWAATMSAAAGAGFYSSYWGAFPFVLAPTPPHEFLVFEIRKPLAFFALPGER